MQSIRMNEVGEFVVEYLDAVLIYSQTTGEQLEHLGMVPVCREQDHDRPDQSRGFRPELEAKRGESKAG